MSSPEPSARADAIGKWLESRLQGSGPVSVGKMRKPGSGLSAGTFFVDATRGAETHHLVVRVPPAAGEGVFPNSDLGRELRFQQLLREGGVPVADVVGMELDPTVLGGPFVVTRKVNGRLVDSSDPYMSSGWLHDESPEYQQTLASDFFGVLGTMHSLAVTDEIIESLKPLDEVDASTELRRSVKRWGRYLDWADNGIAPDSLRSALDWCRGNQPDDRAKPSLLWGDSQLANAVFAEDGSVAALLDFELAGVGQAELDLGWFLCLHDMTAARCGQDLPGFSNREALLAGYEERLGREIVDLRWYEIFGAVCTASILLRMASIFSRGGTDMSWLAKKNPALDYLAEKLA
ncbi:MAG: phosphotransferase family protein [Acidimicrobiales bacterium]|jgi:aminoglycoside phosphotransferase (APT) family kinase protein